jgi:surface-anchored protein
MRQLRSLVLAAALAILSAGCANSSGTSCTVKDNGDGTHTISCPDGTSAVVSDGQNGQNGTNGQDGQTGQTGPTGPQGDAGATGPAGDAGTNGLRSVIALVDEPAGANCASGGTKVMSGLDTNGDGVLQVPGEVQQTSYVCACGVITNSVTVANAQDWTNLVNAGCVRIAGDLTVTTSVASLPGTANVVSVSGNLRVVSNANLTSFSLPALTQVGGVFQVTSNTALTQVNVPKLTAVNSALVVGGCGVSPPENPALTTFNAPLLASAASVEFNTGNAFTALSLPAMRTVTGDFTLGCSTAGGFGSIANISLPALTSVGGLLYLRQVQVSGTASLDLSSLQTVTFFVFAGGMYSSLSFPALQTVGATFELGAFQNATTISAPLLASVGGLRVVANAQLTSFSMPQLATVNGSVFKDLQVSGNPVMTSFSLGALRTVGGSLTVTNNTALKQCLADGLRNQLTSGPTTYTTSGNNGTPNTCP